MRWQRDEMALKVGSDHSLPQERAKHDPIGPAQVVVGAWVALQAVVRSMPHGHITALPRGLAACSQAHDGARGDAHNF